MRYLLSALTGLLALDAHAAVVFDSFAPGGGLASDNSRVGLTGTAGGGFAIPFTPGASGTIEWIESGIQTSNSVADARNFEFRILSDSSGLPGTQVGAFAAQAPFYSSVGGGIPGAIVRHSPGAGTPAISLTAGTHYWLELHYTGPAPVNFTWFFGSPSSSTAANFNGVWSPRSFAFGTPAARISVPGPAPVLVLPVFAAMALRRRRGS